MQISGTLTGVDELKQKIGKLKTELFDEFVNELEEVGDVISDVMRANAPEATGNLRSKIKKEMDIGRHEAEVRIIPDADYAIFVEKGRDAGGMPPIENIRVWANAKGFPDSQVFALARAIAEGRTKANQPNPFVKTTFEDAVKLMDKKTSDIVEKVIRRIFA